MIPFQTFGQFDPPDEFNPDGFQFVVGSTVWKKTWNDGVEGIAGTTAHGQRYDWQPFLWEDSLNGLNLLPGQHHPHFPEFAQIVRTAYRTATVDGEFEGTTAARAAAISALGAWSADAPYAADEAVTSGTSVDAVSGSIIVATAWESKYFIRWSPPFSSRAKIRVGISGGGTVVNIDVVWDGAAGITLGGVQRCFPEVITAPVTDSMWIYDPHGQRTLSALATANRSAGLTFQTPFRNVPLPT